MKNMNQMMKQLQKMQEEMVKAQQELETKEFVGSSGGDVVKITVSGQKQVLGVEIDPQVVDPDDIEMLQDLIVAAFNDALKKVDDTVQKDMGKFTAGMNIPGLF